MKRYFVWLSCFCVLLFFAACTSMIPAVSSLDGKIKGPAPEAFPPPEKCAACHNIDNTYNELLRGPHSELKCLDCHIPGKVLQSKYKREDRSFRCLGYYEGGGNWAECTDRDQVCLRCHKTVINNSTEKCVSCHMPEQGTVKIIIVEDKKEPPTPENIREIIEMAHRSHAFNKYHRE